MSDSALTLRLAGPEDTGSLHRLAELDSQPRLVGDVLLAETGATPWAAVELRSGRVVADPFSPTGIRAGGGRAGTRPSPG